MRIVIDANVLVSGLFWSGTPHALLAHVRGGTTTLFTSYTLLDELADVLIRDKFNAILARARTSRESVLAELHQLAIVVEAQPLPAPVCRDPDDDHVIACAIAAHADAIVSGDNDLRDLGDYQGIPIISVREVLARIR